MLLRFDDKIKKSHLVQGSLFLKWPFHSELIIFLISFLQKLAYIIYIIIKDSYEGPSVLSLKETTTQH